MSVKSLNTSTYILFILLFSLQLRAQPSFTYNPVIICKNAGIDPFPTILTTPPGGIYNSTPGGLAINGTSGQISSGPSLPGMYTVTNTGDPSTAVIITVAPIISPFISPLAGATICPNATPPLIVSTSPVVAITGYTWNSSTTQNVSNTNPIGITTSVTTSYHAIVRDAYGCTYTTTPRLVTVVNFPSNLSLNNPTLCMGGPSVSVAIVSGTVPPGTNYSWLPGGSSSPTLYVSPAVSTTYTLNLTISNCPAKTLTAKVTVSTAPTPTVDFDYPYPICIDDTDPLPIKASGFTEGGTFFSGDVENFPVDPVTGKISLSALAAGPYIINYSLAAQGCRVAMTGTSSITLGEVTRMNVGADVTITEGTGTVLFASNPSSESYLWEPDAGLNCSDCPTPYASPSETTKYCVSDPTNGCNRGSCITVDVVCLNRGDMSVPSAFTPNKDGKNEKFCLKGWSYCVTDFQIRIFNRWGQMVYETTAPDFCWDGTHNGLELPSGVYVYSIEANVNREKVSKNGNITIIR